MTVNGGCPSCGRKQGMSAPPCPACSDAPPPPLVAQPGRLRERHSRWAPSDTTFGPVGRLVATGLVLLPVPLFVYTAGVGFGLVGMVTWGGIILPWALRDIWRAARRS